MGRRFEESRSPALLSRRRALALLSILGAVLALGSVPRNPNIPKVRPILLVDPNTAPVGALEALPRIGPTLAGRIVEARGESPLLGPDDLDRRVRGIGPATVEAIRPHLRFDPIPEPERAP